MLNPIRLTEIPVRDNTYARFTLQLIWQEAPLLLFGALALIVAGVPAWFVWVNTGQVPTASLMLLLGPIPVWTALCYPLGRAATGKTAHFQDAGKALWMGYVRILVTALPPLVVMNLWVAASALVTMDPPLLVVAGVTANLGVAIVLTLVALITLPILILFDLPLVRAWMYGLALTFRWPIVSVGLLALAFLLSLAARALGPAGWVLMPMVLLPFNVTAVLLLLRRGYERELALSESPESQEPQE